MLSVVAHNIGRAYSRAVNRGKTLLKRKCGAEQSKPDISDSSHFISRRSMFLLYSIGITSNTVLFIYTCNAFVMLTLICDALVVLIMILHL